jgi:hypothetical protein
MSRRTDFSHRPILRERFAFGSYPEELLPDTTLTYHLQQQVTRPHFFPCINQDPAIPILLFSKKKKTHFPQQREAKCDIHITFSKRQLHEDRHRGLWNFAFRFETLSAGENGRVKRPVPSVCGKLIRLGEAGRRVGGRRFVFACRVLSNGGLGYGTSGGMGREEFEEC